MDYMGASLRWPIITQPLTHVSRSLRHGNTEMHQLVSLNELQTHILNIELHIYCGLNTKLLHVQNTALWHMLLLLYKSFLSDDFSTKLLRITTEWNNPLLVVFMKYRMLIFLKMRYETTNDGVIRRSPKFHYGNLIIFNHLHQDFTCFEGFTTMNHHNDRRWCVTGCQHVSPSAWNPQHWPCLGEAMNIQINIAIIPNLPGSVFYVMFRLIPLNASYLHVIFQDDMTFQSSRASLRAAYVNVRKSLCHMKASFWHNYSKTAEQIT